MIEEIIKRFDEKFTNTILVDTAMYSLVKDFLTQELLVLQEKTRVQTKIDMIGLFHGVVSDLYGKEIADMLMKIVNAKYLSKNTKEENA